MGVPNVTGARDNFRESFTFTLLTSLSSDSPCWVSPPRDDSNDRWDFLRTVTWLLEHGALQDGDYLVLDNARIHHATETAPIVTALLAMHGVQIRFLPAYSPELNPCELIFAAVKELLRTEPRVMPYLWQEALRHFASFTTEVMDPLYKHCILTPLR